MEVYMYIYIYIYNFFSFDQYEVIIGISHLSEDGSFYNSPFLNAGGASLIVSSDTQTMSCHDFRDIPVNVQNLSKLVIFPSMLTYGYGWSSNLQFLYFFLTLPKGYGTKSKIQQIVTNKGTGISLYM
jgi:hypothetical protein